MKIATSTKPIKPALRLFDNESAPKVAPTHDGRFVLLTKLDFSLIDSLEIPAPSYDYGEDLLSQVYSLNYTSFTALNSATDIAIGDSDQDGPCARGLADGKDSLQANPIIPRWLCSF